MKKKKILILCVVVLICVVGLFFVVGGRNIENTMAKNSDNLSSVETVNVVENLKVSDSVESSTEVPSVENSTNVLEETGSNVNYDRGESKGEIIVNKVEESETVEVVDNTEQSETISNGGDKSLLEILEEAESDLEIGPGKKYVDRLQAELAGEDVSYSTELLFTKTDKGLYEFTPEFIAVVQETNMGKGATAEQITAFFNGSDGRFMVDAIKNSGIRVFIDRLNNDIDLFGTIAPQPSTPSTSTEVANNNNQSTPSTSSTPSSSGGTSSSSGSLPAGWIPDDQLPPAIESNGGEISGVPDTAGNLGDGGALVGNYDIN